MECLAVSTEGTLALKSAPWNGTVRIHPFLQKPMGAAMTDNCYRWRFSLTGCLANAGLTAAATVV